MTEDERFEIIQKVTEALRTVNNIANNKELEVSYETMQRSGFNRKTGWRRKYTLADARGDARNAAIQLRAAWELLDPTSKGHTNASQQT